MERMRVSNRVSADRAMSCTAPSAAAKHGRHASKALSASSRHQPDRAVVVARRGLRVHRIAAPDEVLLRHTPETSEPPGEGAFRQRIRLPPQPYFGVKLRFGELSLVLHRAQSDALDDNQIGRASGRERM